MYNKNLCSLLVLLLAGQALSATSTSTGSGSTNLINVLEPKAQSSYNQAELVTIKIDTLDLSDSATDKQTGKSIPVMLDVKVDGPVKLDLGEHAPSQLAAGIQFNSSFLSTDYFKVIVEGPNMCSNNTTSKECPLLQVQSGLFSIKSKDGKHHFPMEALDTDISDQDYGETPYGIGNETVTFKEAAKYCEDRNYTLATIDASTANVIAQELSRHTNGKPSWLKSYKGSDGNVIDTECLAVYANAEGQIRVSKPKDGCSAKLDVLCQRVKA